MNYGLPPLEGAATSRHRSKAGHELSSRDPPLALNRTSEKKAPPHSWTLSSPCSIANYRTIFINYMSLVPYYLLILFSFLSHYYYFRIFLGGGGSLGLSTAVRDTLYLFMSQLLVHITQPEAQNRELGVNMLTVLLVFSHSSLKPLSFLRTWSDVSGESFMVFLLTT